MEAVAWAFLLAWFVSYVWAQWAALRTKVEPSGSEPCPAMPMPVHTVFVTQSVLARVHEGHRRELVHMSQLAQPVADGVVYYLRDEDYARFIVYIESVAN